MFKKFKYLKWILLFSFSAFLVFFVYRYNKSFKEQYYSLVAYIKKADELKVGAVVRLSGIDVGIVDNLKLTDNFSVKVSFKVKNDIKIPDDSSIVIYTDGLFGPKYLEILPGGSVDYLKNGDIVEFTQNSVDIKDMISIGIDQFKKSYEKK